MGRKNCTLPTNSPPRYTPPPPFFVYRTRTAPSMQPPLVSPAPPISTAMRVPQRAAPWGRGLRVRGLATYALLAGPLPPPAPPPIIPAWCALRVHFHPTLARPAAPLAPHPPTPPRGPPLAPSLRLRVLGGRLPPPPPAAPPAPLAQPVLQWGPPPTPLARCVPRGPTPSLVPPTAACVAQGASLPPLAQTAPPALLIPTVPWAQSPAPSPFPHALQGRMQRPPPTAPPAQ